MCRLFLASIKEIMDKKYGMIVDNSEDGLYNAIKKVIENKDILNKYKKELKGYKYPVEEIIKQIEKLMEE